MAKLNGPDGFAEERERALSGGRRRSSIGAGLAHISRRMSSGLSLVQKKVGRGNSLDFSDTDLCIKVQEMERAFIHHFDDRSIQISNMRMKRDKTKPSCYEAEVFTKGILRVSGKRRVDLNLRVFRAGQEDREFLVYANSIKNIKRYLSKKYAHHAKFLPICESVDIHRFLDQEDEGDCTNTIFILENKSHLGYKKDLMQNCEGLDYEHSVLVITALAKFHAASYSYYQENKVDVGEVFPELCSSPLGNRIPTLSKETIEEISKLFKSNPEYQKYSGFFLGKTIEEEMKNWKSNLQQFGVLCHGNFTRENLLFKYKSNLESRLSPCDAVFQDFSRAFYGSCVMDLYQFLFTSIDIEIRNRFMADFVCSVYYDSFVKTLMSINNTLAVFSKSDFIREFNDKIFCGFVFAAELHTWLVREAEWSCPDRHSRTQADSKYEKYMLALIKDVVKFKGKANVTIEK